MAVEERDQLSDMCGLDMWCGLMNEAEFGELFSSIQLCSNKLTNLLQLSIQTLQCPGGELGMNWARERVL